MDPCNSFCHSCSCYTQKLTGDPIPASSIQVSVIHTRLTLVSRIKSWIRLVLLFTDLQISSNNNFSPKRLPTEPPGIPGWGKSIVSNSSPSESKHSNQYISGKDTVHTQHNPSKLPTHPQCTIIVISTEIVNSRFRNLSSILLQAQYDSKEKMQELSGF